ILDAMVCLSFIVVFFFQAEDGIRDWSVTGVQTCALPISAPATRCPRARRDVVRAAAPRSHRGVPARPRGQGARGSARGAPAVTRSEERRVGKEGGSWWWQDR